MNSTPILFQFADRTSANSAFEILEELGYEPAYQDGDENCILRIHIDRQDVTSALEIAQAYGGTLADSQFQTEDMQGVKEVGSKQESELDPFEIEFLPEFEQGRGPRRAFINRYGVLIGDHMYESPNSPLQQWDEGTEPSIMAGEQWVHPYKDIGFHEAENRDYFERGIPPQSGQFTHPTQDAAYNTYLKANERKTEDNE